MSLQQNGVNAVEGVGIIVPPPEVKEILETTAAFVGKKPAFEARVLQQHDKDPRFSFLKVSDPYHAYYRSKVEEVRLAVNGVPKSTSEGGAAQASDEKAEHRDGKSSDGLEANTKNLQTETAGKNNENEKSQEDTNNAKTTTKGKAVVSFLKSVQAKEEAARPEPREPPEDDLFTIIDVNPALHALGLDVMKLTAQFVAFHGPDFLTALSSKEARNSLFDFLKPLHPHFIVFQRLVDAYKAILDTGEAKAKLMAKLEEQGKSEKAVLDEVWYMHDWECQKAEREHEAAMDESEKLKEAQIDWHDFVVLETVDLDENDPNLPAPVADANQLPKILAAAKKAELEREKNRRNVDMDVDPSGDAPAAPAKTQTRNGMVVTVDVTSDIPADRIRRQPAGGAERKEGEEEATVVLPSGQRVPLSKAEASMRAELLDPSYKDERARAAEKNRVQNLAGGEEMARNLARLGRARTEAGVYNRGDLQGALSKLPRPAAAEVDAGLAKAEASGPRRPAEEGGEGLSGPAKRARVEAAVDALSKVGAGKESVGAVEEVVVGESAGQEARLPGLVGADEWMKKQGTTAQVSIRIPVHASREWKLQGQEIQMTAKLTSTVGKLKVVIAKYTKLPANKQKLQLEGVGFLKDKMTLAYYNVGDGACISLEIKERGGRKKHN